VLAVWLLIHLRKRMDPEAPWISLPSKDLERMGIDHSGKWRALRALEAEGLIRVQRAVGKTALVCMARVN
jgi:hypothetical protein